MMQRFIDVKVRCSSQLTTMNILIRSKEKRAKTVYVSMAFVRYAEKQQSGIIAVITGVLKELI